MKSWRRFYSTEDRLADWSVGIDLGRRGRVEERADGEEERRDVGEEDVSEMGGEEERVDGGVWWRGREKEMGGVKGTAGEDDVEERRRVDDGSTPLSLIPLHVHLRLHLSNHLLHAPQLQRETERERDKEERERGRERASERQKHIQWVMRSYVSRVLEHQHLNLWAVPPSSGQV